MPENTTSCPCPACDDRRAEAAEYIETYQRGLSGIYPWRLAEHVAAMFALPTHDARELVMAHIHRVMEEDRMSDGRK